MNTINSYVRNKIINIILIASIISLYVLAISPKSNISKSRKLYKDRCTGVGPFLSGVQN